MIPNSFLFLLGSAAIVILWTTLFIFWKIARRRGMISRSLDLRLIEVRFPHYPPSEANVQVQQIREKIALMEQFYSHLRSVRESPFRRFIYGKPVFALELAIPHVGEQLIFYVAVSKRLIPTVEQVIQGIFPDAQVELASDYNIFNPAGANAGAYLTLKPNRFYPIKTYQKLEGDPMKALTNIFTKLAKTGEGAALQIVVTPASHKWQRKLKEHARKLHEGKRVAKTAGGAVMEIFDELVRGSAQKPTPDQRMMDPMKRLTPLQDETVRGLEGKASKPLFEVNIRLLASAATTDRAAEILGGLEVGFGQFNDPNSNSFFVVRAGGASLKRIVFHFSFRTFDEKRKLILASDELTSLFHFPNVPTETPGIKVLKAHEAPPPPNLPQEGLLLGYNVFREQKIDIRIMDEDRRRHLYVIGQTGTGKTAFMKNMIVQDIEAGKGVCFIDPHGDTAEELLGLVPRHRVQDVIYFNPGDVERPMGLNMLEYDPNFPEQKTFIVNELLSIFDKLYNMSVAGGPMFEQYFRNATLLTMDDPDSGNTLLEIERVLTDKAFRDHKLSKSKNIVVKNFWTQIAEKAGGEASLKDIVPYIASKFDNFIANEIMRPIIAQDKSAFHFREVMDNQKILLVNLSKGRLGELNSSLIGLIIVGKLLMAALSRTDMPEEKRKDFYLHIDEFQNVTTDSISTILSEARKYRLDLTITHQFIGQLKEEIKKAVFGNVGSMVAFRIGSDDAEFMAKQFKPVFNEQDLLNIDNRNCYVKPLINGMTVPPFSMKTYAPTKGEAELAAIVKEISRTKYGRPRTEVEQEILDRHTKPLV